MARPATVTEDELLHRLTREFRRVGYEGASLTSLSEATGLKKASLYHRFPGGKEQMAREVLAAAHEWLDCHILQPLRSDRSPRERVEAMVRELDAFYDGGRQACLLNVFAAPLGETGPFAEMVREVLVSWLEALTATLVESGIEYETARKRARRADPREPSGGSGTADDSSFPGVFGGTAARAARRIRCLSRTRCRSRIVQLPPVNALLELRSNLLLGVFLKVETRAGYWPQLT